MSPRPTGRSQACGPTEARTRLSQARAFLEVAELVGTEQHEVATPHVAAALAVSPPRAPSGTPTRGRRSQACGMTG